MTTDGKHLATLFVLVAVVTLVAGLVIYWATNAGVSIPAGMV